MVVKIYLPKCLYDRKKVCELYGDVVIEEKSISYFIISDQGSNPDLRLLGHIRPSEGVGSPGYSVVFCYNNYDPHIYLYSLSVKLSEDDNINLFLYDDEEFYYIDVENRITQGFIESGDVYFLRALIKAEVGDAPYKFEEIGIIFFRFIAEVLRGIEYGLTKIGFINKFVSSTTLYEHSKIWQKNIMRKDFHRTVHPED